MKRIAIFASGSGTNAENIIRYFQKSSVATVVLVLSNKKDAKVLERAKKHKVKSLYFNRNQFKEEDFVLKMLKNEADFIVLAGFLLKIPEKIVSAFPQKIINIHPALLPKFGGKGMYGKHVHNAVLGNKEKESGITIHYVNENYDEGNIIFQKALKLHKSETPESLAKRIHKLEYEFFPKIIEELLRKDE